jgi:hypothetical protein
MISENELYKFIGLAVVLLFLISMGVKMFNYQTKIVEGMTNSTNTDIDKIADSISGATDRVDTQLAIQKHRPHYEDMIIALDTNCADNILYSIMINGEAISKNPTSEESQKAITNLNNLAQFRTTLNDAIKHLDKK